MDPVDALTSAHAALVIAPPAPPDDVDALATELGTPLPHELGAVLAYTARVDGSGVGTIDFTGRSMDYEDRDLFPAGLPIATDDAGNFWVLDLVTDPHERTAVFFASHDPPVVVYESDDLGGWLARVLDGPVTPPELASSPPLLEHAASLTGDDELRAFAATLDDRFLIADLRSPSPGLGFEWGRFGPRTEVRRHGFVRLFALAPPAQRPGGLRSLFRR